MNLTSLTKENVLVRFLQKVLLVIGILLFICLGAVKKSHGLVYTITDLGTLGGSYSYGLGINSSGQVVGSSALIGDTAEHAFFYSGGVMTDLGTLGGSYSWAWGINNSGQVMGWSLIPGDYKWHAFLYSGGVMTDLGTLGGSYSDGWGINNSGQVVGGSTIPGDTDWRPFLYSGGVITDLNTLLPSGSGWILHEANAINDKGQIVGYGEINDEIHAFLMSPINNTPPKALCKDVTVPVESGLCTADTSIDGGSFDPDGDPTTVVQSPAGPYPLGDTSVTLTVTDASGASDSCTATVTVVDTDAPMIGAVSASPNVLWPPNHKMVAVAVIANATDNCSAAPVCKIVSVMSNEPVNGLGDGDTAPDWMVSGDLAVKLRAERSGIGSGRIYTITVGCADASGNSSSNMTVVTVPKDQGKKK